MNYLSTQEIALELGLSKRTVQKYCKIGFLPANLKYIQGRAVYEVEDRVYLEWKNKHFKGIRRGKINLLTRSTKELSKTKIIEEAEIWIDWGAKGILVGKPLAPRTLEIYQSYFTYYLKMLPTKPCLPIISVENLRLVLSKYPAESYSTKQKIYDSIMSFSKYLVETNQMTEESRNKLIKLRPKRFLPPRRTVLKVDQLDGIINYINSSKHGSDFDRLLNKTLFLFISFTGLRAKEVCNLKLKDVDFESQTIYIWLGKGNKNRKVGFNEETKQLLIDFLKKRLTYDGESFFVNGHGKTLTTKTLMQKIRRIAKNTDIDITCHGLRRTFASLNSSRGKPLNHLRIALGHADLATTQSYIMTTENEVVEAMREW